MHLLIKARSGGLIVKNDGNGVCSMDLLETEEGRALPLAGESLRRGMLSYILGEVRRVHTRHDEPPLFDDALREQMLSRMKVRVVKEPFCHTVFGQYSTKVLPSKIRINDFGWDYANGLIKYLRPALTRVTGMETLGDVNDALQDALLTSGAKQRKFFVALKKKNEGKTLTDKDLLALRYKDELEMLIPQADLFQADVKIEKKLTEYLASAERFVRDGFSGKKTPVSELHFKLLSEIQSLCKDPRWRRGLHEVKSTKFSIIPFPAHTAQWVDVPQDKVLYVRGAPMVFATCDFDLVVPDLSDEEKERVLRGPMSCFYGKWGTGFVSLEESLQLDEFDESFPAIDEQQLKIAGVVLPKIQEEELEAPPPDSEESAIEQ